MTPQTRREWLASLTPEERRTAARMAGDLMARQESRGELIQFFSVMAAIAAALGLLAWLA